jgi:GrpB-like predicted nucleotidyltransferase (UPF0157 family)
MLSADDIVRFSDEPAPPGASPWVGDAEPQQGIEIVEPDPAWGAQFARLVARIRGALGEAALVIVHVGSCGRPSAPNPRGI